VKTVIITGASRGIGKATAEKFLVEGWRLVGTSKTGNLQFYNERSETYTLDLADAESIREFESFIRKLNISIQVLVNNAAISIDQNQRFSVDVLRKTLEVNLIGLTDLTERIIPYITRGGHIINLSSGLGSLTHATNPYYPTYRISKAAVNMYTRHLASRLQDKHILVSSIDPGWVKTGMGGSGATRNPSEAAQDIYDLAVTSIETGFFWYKGRKKEW
jgi:NAD(P)-dependent dehydrogenase (short-subunit alcohol dehydrogenase family)